MQIVIDINDYDREWIKNGYYIPNEINGKIAEAIINGTPLPEGHGRLIDVDALFDYFGDDAINEVTRSNIEYFIRESKATIIEADTESEKRRMTTEQQIARITEIINENDFAEVTKAKFEEAFDDMSITEIKETIWKLYCFMSDVVDTINM